MGVLLKDNRHWAHASWISRAFFNDCLQVLFDEDSSLQLEQDLLNGIKFESYTLNYEDVDLKRIKELFEVEKKVIIHNQNQGAIRFSSKDWFDTYITKLNGLSLTLSQLIEAEDKSNN